MISPESDPQTPDDRTATTSQEIRQRTIIDVFDACLDMPGETRAAWIAQKFPNDADAVEEVMALLAADEMAPSIMPTEIPGSGGTTVLVPPHRIGPYRLEDIVGSGGMGEVWRGIRDDGLFDQEVAIKLMRPSLYPAASLAFFDTERRALARLTHRHIARLYDGGVTEAGLPWFIMEMIDGEPLDLYAAGHQMQRDASLELMAKIAEAVQYAHQQLVVHADLKPSNILVTPLGEPVLVDFGIASLAANAAERTERGAFPSTPAYASPQRLAGEAPTPSDDIFSLGLLLYGLMSGNDHPPWNDPKVLMGSPDVQAIIGKACADKVEDRYATAADLAKDLRAVLACRPTSLQSDWRDRMRLMVKRNPKTIGATALGIAGALCASVLITFLYIRADYERSRAEARFNDVRELANYMIGDFHDELIKLPGSTPLSEKNAAMGWEYLTRLARDETVSDDVKRDIAVGFGRLGNAQATTTSSGSGKVVDGDWALLQSETLLRDLVQKYPARDDFKRELARTLVWRSGVILGVRHDPTTAQAVLDEAFALFDDVLKDNPADIDAAYWRWNATLAVGDYMYARSDWAGLKVLMEKTQIRFATLATPSSFQSMRVLLDGATENYLGDSNYYLDGPEAGIMHYKRAQDLLSQARRTGITDIRVVLREAYYDYQLASSYLDTQQPALAIEWADKGQAVLGNVNTFDPTPATQHTYDIVNMQRALGLSELGRTKEAAAQIGDTLARRRTLLARSPEDQNNRLGLAIALADASGFYLKAKAQNEACGVAREALDNFDYLNRNGGVAEPYRSGSMAQMQSIVEQCSIAAPVRAG